MMTFAWDENKAAANLRMHGVAFKEALEVFDDSEALVIPDDDHSVGERRFLIIGASNRRLLLMVYVDRDRDLIRIVSARNAEPYEQRIYHEG